MDNDITDGVSYTVKLGDTYKNSLNIKWRTLDCTRTPLTFRYK